VSGGIAPRFLTSALGGGECSASRSGRFTARERAPSTHWIGGWVGSTEHGGEEKNSQPMPGLRLQIIQPVAQSYNPDLYRLLYYCVSFPLIG
jgi:hypothetical protein